MDGKMKLNSNLLLLPGLLLALTFLSGCDQKAKPAGMPDLYPCSITITQGGGPLQGALVRLEPKQGGNIGWGVDGRTNARGVAQIATGIDFKGAPAGEYFVLVSKTEMAPSKFSPTSPEDPAEAAKWYNDSINEKRAIYRLVKAEFDNTKTTTLSITIAKGKNNATFDVGEPVKEEIK